MVLNVPFLPQVPEFVYPDFQWTLFLSSILNFDTILTHSSYQLNNFTNIFKFLWNFPRSRPSLRKLLSYSNIYLGFALSRIQTPITKFLSIGNMISTVHLVKKKDGTWRFTVNYS